MSIREQTMTAHENAHLALAAIVEDAARHDVTARFEQQIGRSGYEMVGAGLVSTSGNC